MTHGNVKYPLPADLADFINANGGVNCTKKKIEKEYGVNTQTVTRWLRLSGIKLHKPNQDLGEQFGKEFLIAEIANCSTSNDANELVKRLGINKLRLETFCKKNNIEYAHLKGKTIRVAPTKDELENLIRSGWTNQRIEQKYEITNTVLKRWYKELNIKRAPYEGTLTEIPSRYELEELHLDDQFTVQQLASHFSTSYQKVIKWLQEYGIEQNYYRSKRSYQPSREEFIDLHLTQKKTFKEMSKIWKISDVQVGNLAKEFEIDNVAYGIGQTSLEELSVLEFIHKFDPTAGKISLEDHLKINQRNSRVSYDIYIPSINTIIEYNGLRWHKEQYIHYMRHYNKMKLAHHHGHNIINLYSDEWANRRKIVESIIKSKFKVNERVYARSLEVVEISTRVANKFYNDNHIQGRSNYYNRSYGLMRGEELVACMSFGIHHRSNSGEIILKRFANKINLNIVGGASKLFTHAIKNNPSWDEIISWSDNRWFTGRIYEILGFKHDKDISIRYEYVYNDKERRSAQSHTKKRIGCPDGMSERDFLISKGIYRIWDCGKKRWKWKRGS